MKGKTSAEQGAGDASWLPSCVCTGFLFIEEKQKPVQQNEAYTTTLGVAMGLRFPPPGDNQNRKGATPGKEPRAVLTTRIPRHICMNKLYHLVCDQLLEFMQ